ncbi:ATP-binding protein [Actinocorallia aurantiaca]|uniref:Histidine kinase/HSP90-like ATPase domain-containing protein n=1 Tax=Actinocorallia aurantiaca TaxID=46204 RepID=A0ABP6GMN6_9ACTN
MGSLVVLGSVGFGGEDSAVPAARRYARGLLDGEGVDAGEAQLIVSELVTNAVAHGGEGGFRLTVSVGDDVVRIEVADSGVVGKEPQVREAADEDEEGRGLLIVDALTRRWGVHEDGDGTVVWAELEKRPVSSGLAGETG